MKYLVDSDRVADYLKGQPDAVSLLRSLWPDGLAISIVTFGEVYEGIYYGRDPKYRSSQIPDPLAEAAESLAESGSASDPPESGHLLATSGTKGNEAVFRAFLRGVRVLLINRSVARRFALIRGELRAQGNVIPQPDSLIAATALHHGLSLVTRNVKDFQRVRGLTIHRP